MAKASTKSPAKHAGKASSKPTGGKKPSKAVAAPGPTKPPSAPAPPSKPLPPPAHLPTIKAVDAAPWYRVHDYDAATGKYAPEAFNDSGKGNARFSPLRRKDGTVIPTIYAAAHERTAVAEILLHEAPNPSTGWTFEWSKVGDPAISNKHLSLVALPALKLAALTTFGLQAAGLVPEDLTGGNASDYARTQSWALWLYENMPDIQGLYWMSRRDNEYACVMLFEDRIPGGIKPIHSHHISVYARLVLSTVLLMNAQIG